MKLSFLGTGTSQGVPVINCRCNVCLSTDPEDKRLRSSISIESDSHGIVVDVGPDFRAQLLAQPLQKIDAVLLTHEHNDHTAGLDDLRPFNFIQKSSIPIYASARVIRDIQDRFKYAFIESPYPGAPSYDMIEIQHGDSWKIGETRITAFEVIHGDLPILNFKFDDLVYITDAKYIPRKSMQIIQDCEILIINALRKKEHWSHFTLKEALKMIEEINPSRAYLTHVSHKMGKHHIEQKSLPENVFFAYDKLSLQI